MTIIEGKIQAVMPIQEFPKDSGKFNIGIKVNNQYYNKYAEKGELETFRDSLKNGYEIKIETLANKIIELEIISAVADKPEAKKGSFQDQLDRVNYKTLMAEAHRLGIKSTSVELVPELTNIEKKMACFRATIVMEDGKTFVDFGEACGAIKEEGGNIISPEIALAYIRMASTRSLVRALRQATCNMETAEEEMPEGDLPSDH